MPTNVKKQALLKTPSKKKNVLDGPKAPGVLPMTLDEETLELIVIAADVPNHKYKIGEIQLYRKKKSEIAITKILEQAEADAEIIIREGKTKWKINTL
jgi:hypothetical protein